MKLQIAGSLWILISTAGLTAPAFAQTKATDGVPVVQRAWTNDTPAKLAESLRLDGGVVRREKYGFHWETRIEPPAPNFPGAGFSTRAMETNGAIHRIMIDRNGKTYFGYDVTVEELPEANTYRLTFRPLVMEAEIVAGLALNRIAEWTSLPAPRSPAPQTVHKGEILEITLLTNNQSKQRIVDYVSIQEPDIPARGFQLPRERVFSFSTGIPRDITADDIQLTIKAPRLSLNGKQEESTSSHFDDVTGTFVWFYLPNHGRFILALGPHPELGFRKAGEIRGSSLEFMIGPDRYTLSTGARIAPGQAAFNLYVIQQPNWKPTYPFADTSAFTIGATDQFEAIEK